MARIILLSDIHGNLTALEAVLANVRLTGADRVVCLGDVAAMGPQPREVIGRLRELGCPVVMGNTDAWLAEPPPARAVDEVARQEEEWLRWGADQLTADDRAFFRSFAPTVEVPLDHGGTLLCYHGSPRSFNDALLPATPPEDLDKLLGGNAAATVFAGGHTHQQMLRRHRASLVINGGAIGRSPALVPLPSPLRYVTWAEYAILNLDGSRLGVELRRVPYDRSALLATARRAGMPHEAAWSAQWDAAG